MRVTVEPNSENGLHKRSQAMVDKILTVRQDKVGQVMGRIDMTTLTTIDAWLFSWGLRNKKTVGSAFSIYSVLCP
ncbi:type II toxin-antitoxin system PemK/MazF family toxin [Hydrogenophilus thiooxidans]|uniref:type II toxin-antitoxin system PemK/MazF family toxin n=1 Tax=Hydrogenophilus thiooxidans TaxID=2820326 RepID=UPI002017AD9E|nr:type II toxin-antitoxin system PemK/MazF family toxin [Hydrogenophilus thiooxidans]